VFGPIYLAIHNKTGENGLHEVVTMVGCNDKLEAPLSGHLAKKTVPLVTPPRFPIHSRGNQGKTTQVALTNPQLSAERFDKQSIIATTRSGSMIDVRCLDVVCSRGGEADETSKQTDAVYSTGDGDEEP
jgi:hypothetical protein